MLQVKNDLGISRGGGDEVKLQPIGNKTNDPDEIICLGPEDEIPEELNYETGHVYRTCSVSSPIGKSFMEIKKNNEATHEATSRKSHGRNGSVSQETTSSWSVLKIVRNSLLRFKCCQETENEDTTSEPGIELENFCEERTKEHVDTVDMGSGKSVKNCRVICGSGPIMTIDCSKDSLDEELHRVKNSLGDVVRKLVIKNSPIQSAMKILHEAIISENVTALHLVNCDLSARDLFLILKNLSLIENLKIEMKHMGESGSTLLMEDFQKFHDCKSYFSEWQTQLSEEAKAHPNRLKSLTISLPMIWQCSVICRVLEASMGCVNMTEINIKSSLKEMIIYLITTPGIVLENESTWKDKVTLEARDLIWKNSSSLKHLSIACADTFPIEYLWISKNLGLSVETLYKFCFFTSCGILTSIVSFGGDVESNTNGHLYLPMLTNLSLDLPLLPIPFTRDDDFRKPLNAVAEFLARNNNIHVVSLLGLRPVKGMENWIRNALITIPKYRMSIGCTYTSTTIASNLPVFDDELGSLGLEIVADDCRQRVTDIIDPQGMEIIPSAWRYSGMKCFHLVNRLPTLVSYDLDRIASKFSKLTKLAIEDFTIDHSAVNHGENGVSPRSLNDFDMQMIFSKLVCLEYLHLDCNMKNMTDRGLTGISDSFWCKLTQKDKMYSFWYLYNLKYIFMRGFGHQVTDKSAIYAFSEEFSMKKLKELHVFAPGFTNHGREKIRRAFAGRNDFILRM